MDINPPTHTFVEFRHRRLSLLGQLRLHVLLVRLVRLDVVPRVELVHIVVGQQVARPKLERIAALEAVV